VAMLQMQILPGWSFFVPSEVFSDQIGVVPFANRAYENSQMLLSEKNYFVSDRKGSRR